MRVVATCRAVAMAVLTPMTSPRALTSGPQESSSARSGVDQSSPHRKPTEEREAVSEGTVHLANPIRT